MRLILLIDALVITYLVNYQIYPITLGLFHFFLIIVILQILKHTKPIEMPRLNVKKEEWFWFIEYRFFIWQKKITFRKRLPIKDEILIYREQAYITFSLLTVKSLDKGDIYGKDILSTKDVLVQILFTRRLTKEEKKLYNQNPKVLLTSLNARYQ